MPFPKKGEHTADEFFEIIPESNSERYELYNGEIVAQAAPSTLHQHLVGELFGELRNYIKRNSGKCRPFISPFDVKLDDYNVVQPDVLVICDPSKLDDKRCCGAPDFVIEVASSNRSDDFVRKLELYQRFGVREYWIVDIENQKTVVYHFDKSLSPNIYAFGISVPVGIYDGKLTINIAEIII